MDYLDGMNDVRLKPRLLRSLLRDRLPDEKQLSPGPSELATVLCDVKTYGLLSERAPGPAADPKLMESWKLAVDEWVDRLMSLISSKMPDKCWAGTCLLGVTCEECSSERFIGSYSVWFQQLLLNLQPLSSSQFVKVASCASLADLFTRLVAYSSVKKDATSLAGKLVQPVLQLLSEDDNASLEGALQLLNTLTSIFPSSIHRHYDNVESALVSIILSGRCNADVSMKVACCLALLPKVKGDEDTWSLMMRRILISINMLLNDAFQGLEEETKNIEIMRLLVPPGKDPPPPLGDQLLIEGIPERTTKRLHDILIPRISTLMYCCCKMLTNPYPIQVVIPIRALLALVGRVLLQDGSLHQKLLPFTTSLHQELLCSELSSLHSNSLDLLIAIIKGVRSQLLPHAANVVRLVTEYFRRAVLAPIRIKLYSIIQILLISMGVGMALYLTQEVISNAFADLNDHPVCGLPSSNTNSAKVVSEVSGQSTSRKRKHGYGAPMEHPNGVDLEAEAASRKLPAPLAVKIAALRALEALLTVGGSLRSEFWRSDVDLLLITVTTNACDAGWASEGKLTLPTDQPASSRADFQLASLKALLASLLSSAHVRPPYLSQGLELFCRGKQETGTELAAFCTHALLALEVLIHPRALPLVDLPVAKISMNDGFNSIHQKSTALSNQKLNMPPFLRGNIEAISDLEDDELYSSWLRSEEEAPVGDDQLGVDIMDTEQLVKHPIVDSERNAESVDKTPVPPHTIDVEIREVVSTDTSKSQEPSHNNGADHAWDDANCLVPAAAIPSTSELEAGNKDAPTGNTANLMKDVESTPAGSGPVLNRNEMVTSAPINVMNQLEDGSPAPGKMSISSKGKGSAPLYNLDSESSDSLPDIVDDDPDSD
ncbi:proline-, glutamic acid- and leucine-rich protein 1 [Dioscorea cayenensis subsp. rotundata]|uniref:Proline-, glutamic acid- and leucine-rich protein 1 n=1 Tax=Dioscorea cayennensis subsp. rotundata TaxID=55577 RepID=A0AB40BCY4_DIOCR|nr:proline-, glutamic acid- and leucine-rich protein 1 [Dioscorea cayenensis subsp. rotundata]